MNEQQEDGTAVLVVAQIFGLLIRARNPLGREMPTLEIALLLVIDRLKLRRGSTQKENRS